MKCQQKSGVFLNLSCSNAKRYTCANCKKGICETHTHMISSMEQLCEDCYWEAYLYSTRKKDSHLDDHYIDTYTDFNTVTYTSSTASSDPLDSDNREFGGGEFGGGGASGMWTEGDMQSLEDTPNTTIGSGLSNDDTFFYS